MQGHHKGVRSTKPATEEEENDENEKLEPCQHEIIITIHDMSRTLYTNQTRKLLHTSRLDNKYQMILHTIESKSTWIEPMKNIIKGEIIISREHALKQMCLCGLNPRHQILDNEASEKYKEAICASVMTYQIVPLDNHCRNIDKKPIQFWMDHFIAVLRGTATTHPPPHVVPGKSSSRKTIVMITTIKFQQKYIFICPLTRQPRLFCPPLCAYRNGGTHSQKSQPKESLG